MSAQDLLVGDRIVNPGEVVVELTVDGTWTAVCRLCDVAMTSRNEVSELCCPRCGGTYQEVMAIG